MDKVQVVQTIISKLGGKTYLEIGSASGNSFFPIQARRKLAVDPKFEIAQKERIKRTVKKALRLKEERYFAMTSDDFFLKKSYLFKKNMIDVALVDGLHDYRQSLRDVFNCLKYLSPNGVIVMHDCNPTTEAMAWPALSFEDAESKKLKGWEGAWCGDVWKTIVDLRSSRDDLYIFVLDCDFGVGIVTRGKPERMLKYSQNEINALTYYDLNRDRTELVNLKPYGFLDEFIKKVGGDCE